MPIRTLRITSGHREELIQLCRQYSDLQKKAVEIRCALNDKVAALAGVLESSEVAGLSIDFTQIEVVSMEEWKEAVLNVTASERWVCTGFAPTEADLRVKKASIETLPSISSAKSTSVINADVTSRTRGLSRCAGFLRNHAKAICGLRFRVHGDALVSGLYVFVAMEIGSRKLLHLNVTPQPTRRGPCSNCEKQFLATTVIAG